jgi:hypothetical protein
MEMDVTLPVSKSVAICALEVQQPNPTHALKFAVMGIARLTSFNVMMATLKMVMGAAQLV